MFLSILTVFIFQTAALGSHTGGKESRELQWRRANENTKESAAKQVVECVIKHQKNAFLGSFLPVVTMALGSPPQKFSALLDTGSGDFIVGRTGSAFCKIERANCSDPQQGGRGSFNPEKSANTSVVGSFDAHYFNQQNYLGEFRRGVATVGGIRVRGLQFGLADNGTGVGPGAAPLLPLLGIGPILGETVSTPSYPNLPARMREEGVIKSNVYGVYLNDFRGLDGSIVFGGVDTAKFTGELKEAPLVPGLIQVGAREQLSSFRVDFSSFQLVDSTSSQNTSQDRNPVQQTDNTPPPNGITNLAPQQGLPPAFLDTGNPAVNIPQESIETLVKALGAEILEGFVSRIKCKSLQGKALRFGFNRDNAVIDVPLDLLVVPSDISNDLGANLPPGMCNTVIGTSKSLPAGLNIASLGAPVMQAMYVVFDVERSRLMFAPALINSTASHLRELSPEWTGTVIGKGAPENSEGIGCNGGCPGSPGSPGGTGGSGRSGGSTVISASDAAAISSFITLGPGRTAALGLVIAVFCL